MSSKCGVMNSLASATAKGMKTEIHMLSPFVGRQNSRPEGIRKTESRSRRSPFARQSPSARNRMKPSSRTAPKGRLPLRSWATWMLIESGKLTCCIVHSERSRRGNLILRSTSSMADAYASKSRNVKDVSVARLFINGAQKAASHFLRKLRSFGNSSRIQCPSDNNEQQLSLTNR